MEAEAMGRRERRRENLWPGFVGYEGGASVYTMAMRAIVDSGVKLRGDVTLECVVDEELTENETLAAMQRGYVADAGISCETSSLRVQPPSIGRIWFEIEVRGKPASIQRRWEEVYAIEKGYKITQAVNDFETIRLEQVRHHSTTTSERRSRA